MKSRENPPGKILIVKLSAIGDVVQTIPMVEALRAHFPEAQIDWAIEEEASDLILGYPGINRVIVSRRKSWLADLWRSGGWRKALREIRAFLRELRSSDYDWVIDNHGILKSGLIVFLSRGRRKIGFKASPGIADEGSYLFTHERYPALGIERHALERYLDLIAQLGVPVENPCLQWPVNGKVQEKVKKILAENGVGFPPLVVIHPMAKWPTKNWPAENFSRLAQALSEKGMSIVFTGSPEDGKGIAEIIARVPDRNRVRSLAGKTTLKELAGLFAEADLVLSTDTGPMHLAAATGTRLVALFGPTAPWRTGPYGKGHVVIRRKLSCSPCFRKECETIECMRTITVEEVMAAIEGKLREGSEGSRVQGFAEKQESKNFSNVC